MSSSIRNEIQEFKILGWHSDNKKYPGIDCDFIYTEFNSNVQVGDRYTYDYYDGIQISIVSKIDTRYKCKVITNDPKDYCEPKYLGPTTRWFRISI